MPQVRSALSVEDFMEVFRKVTPIEYSQAIETDPAGSVALIRSIAKIFAEVANRGLSSAQSCFFIPYQTQAGEPASSATFAEFTAVVQRTEDRFRHLVMIPGALTLEGSQRRIYRNVELIEWEPFDTTERTITFRCEAIGEVGNLDHIADPNGRITKQDETTPDTDAVFIANQSYDRTSINASIEPGTAAIPRTRLVDSGLPDQFVATDVGLYVRLPVANANNIGRVMRIIGYAEASAPEADGRLRRSVEVDDGPQRFRLMSAVLEDNSAVFFSGQTAVANGDVVGTVQLLPDPLGTDDAFYVGGVSGDGPPSSVVFNISVAGVGSWALAWEYWDGAAWQPLPDLNDRTAAFTLPGEAEVSWTVPVGWATNTIDGVTAYHARARVTSVAPTLTTQPRASSGGVYLLHPDPLTAEVGVVTWQVLDWRDLGLSLTSINAATGGKDNVLGLVGEERGMHQQTDETDDTFRARISKLPDTISPNAIARAVNRILQPFGFRGRSIDLAANGAGDLFEGFYCDIDACDYYEPGDAFPLNTTKLMLSRGESKGWFFVYVPYLGFGDFGIGVDEGPVLQLDSGEFIGSAADSGFLDGYPVDGNAAYRAIHEVLTKIKLWRVGFTIIRDPTLNAAPCP